jgi:dihydrodipicolinate synthase/N-acetylneuraminate lyase
MSIPLPPKAILDKLHNGLVIPPHPLALNQNRKLDERRQAALTRYYCAAGAGGVALGVHTTQFEIRHPKIGLLEPVLTLAGETLNEVEEKTNSAHVRIAGIVGRTQQAAEEARLAVDLRYHAGLVSLGDLPSESNDQLLEHLKVISEIIPLFGFYLQPDVGGRRLDYRFWREATEIQNLIAIKIAPFNRYQTLDVMRAVADSGRADEIALYTGNDDHVVLDLLSEFQIGSQKLGLKIAGGLLGQWSVWTKRAVGLLNEIQRIREERTDIPNHLIRLALQITDANSAIFDASNNFRGCIPGIHEVLRRQGLLAGRWTLDPSTDVSPGQLAEIDRVYARYPQLNDDEFVKEHLDDWLK